MFQEKTTSSVFESNDESKTDEASVVSQKGRGKTVLAELAWNTLLLIKPSILARELLAVAPTNLLFVSEAMASESQSSSVRRSFSDGCVFISAFWALAS